MQINTDIIETTHNLDALVRAARLHPTETLIQHLIDLELDTNGNYVGFDLANRVWHEAVKAN